MRAKLTSHTATRPDTVHGSLRAGPPHKAVSRVLEVAGSAVGLGGWHFVASWAEIVMRKVSKPFIFLKYIVIVNDLSFLSLLIEISEAVYYSG